MAALGSAIDPAVRAIAGTNGEDISPPEIAERLFEIGPIVVKMGQVIVGFAEKQSQSARAELLKSVGEAFQEDIAPPTDEEATTIASHLPPGLRYVNHRSSASIAHVEQTEAEGEQLVTKTVRPNIGELLEKNVAINTIVVDVLSRFIETYSGDSKLAEKLRLIKEAVPFGMRVVGDDIVRQFDLTKERANQIEARRLIGSKRVVIPEVVERYSDDRNLTMRDEPAVRVEDLPANPARLRNLIAFGIQSVRKRFLHGDPHAGNLKSREDGTLVAYDWQPVRLTPRIMTNMGAFLYALRRRNPEAIARTYTRIQSTEYNQATEAKALAVAQNVVASLKERGVPKGIRKSKIAQDFSIAMAIRHQSVLDTTYIAMARAPVAFSSVLKLELAKDYYQGRKFSAVLRGFVGAMKDVYLD